MMEQRWHTKAGGVAACANSEDATATTHAGPDARHRWRKGRLVVVAASKFQQAGVDGAARRDAEVVPDATKREEAQRRWRKGRLVIVAASKFQQAGVDGAARREAEAVAVATTGEEARRRWRKGRLLVAAAGRFKMAGEDGAARRAMEDEAAVAVPATMGEQARRRWHKGRQLVKRQAAGAQAIAEELVTKAVEEVRRNLSTQPRSRVSRRMSAILQPRVR